MYMCVRSSVSSTNRTFTSQYTLNSLPISLPNVTFMLHSVRLKHFRPCSTIIYIQCISSKTSVQNRSFHLITTPQRHIHPFTRRLLCWVLYLVNSIHMKHFTFSFLNECRKKKCRKKTENRLSSNYPVSHSVPVPVLKIPLHIQ